MAYVPSRGERKMPKWADSSRGNFSCKPCHTPCTCKFSTSECLNLVTEESPFIQDIMATVSYAFRSSHAMSLGDRPVPSGWVRETHLFFMSTCDAGTHLMEPTDPLVPKIVCVWAMFGDFRLTARQGHKSNNVPMTGTLHSAPGTPAP
uniref:Uncharacterized protein n=1 Tax=Branchiostoma floridae TaxID=7739 RepID=C3Y5W0_BRAFL|eukprot:XP_002608347.1 hypothetical protein BRAFLDRAFT_91302 [Branchiostoma floridae]